jgi:hypothetical protein
MGKKRGKRLVSKSGISIEHAAAFHLVAQHKAEEPLERHLRHVLKAVKQMILNKGLTYYHLKIKLRKWITDGWLELRGKILKITDTGLDKLKAVIYEIPQNTITRMKLITKTT